MAQIKERKDSIPKVLWSHFISKFPVFPPGKRGTGSVRFWMEEMADMVMIPTLGCSRCMAYCDCLIVFAKIGYVGIYCIHFHPESIDYLIVI